MPYFLVWSLRIKRLAHHAYPCLVSCPSYAIPMPFLHYGIFHLFVIICVALPILVGAWSMAVLLGQFIVTLKQFEQYDVRTIVDGNRI